MKNNKWLSSHTCERTKYEPQKCMCQNYPRNTDDANAVYGGDGYWRNVGVEYLFGVTKQGKTQEKFTAIC